MHGKAKEQAEIDSEKEIIETSTVQAMGKNKYGNVIQSELEEKLNNNTGNDKTEVIDNGDTLVVKFIDSGRYYEVDSNGNVSEPIEIIVDEYAGDLTKGGIYDGSSEEMSYQINCIEDLVSFSRNVNSGNSYDGKYVKLMRTLDFNSIFSYNNYKTTYSYDVDTNSYIEDINSNTTLIDLCTNDKGFIPIGNSASVNARYRGNFNGQGFEIKNIYINTTANAGLFGECNLATIQNLGISGNITSTKNHAGGIVATASCRFINCFNNANIKADSYAGGIVGTGGSQSISMSDCYNTGMIISEKGLAGGLAATFAGKISNSYNIGEVKSNSSYSGGILGQAAGAIVVTNCYNSGNIYSGGWQSGGIVAYEYVGATIENCYNTGDISSINSAVSYRCAKGIGGTTTTNCYNIGKLSSDNKCYAISENTIKNCYYDSLKVGNIVGTETIEDIKNINIDNFVNLLNSYIDDTGVYPENWKKWKMDEKNGYPTFE